MDKTINNNDQKMVKNEKKKKLSVILTSPSENKSCHIAPIPTLRRDNFGIEPCQVGILISHDKVIIPTLRWTIPTLRRTYILEM